MKRLLWVVMMCLAVFGGFAVAKDAPRASTVWEFKDAKDFESQHPGLGYTEAYRSAHGLVSVYVYTMQANWVDGVVDPKLKDELESTVAQIREAARIGAYQDLRVGELKTVTINGQEFLQIFMSFKLKGESLFSQTYLTARQGHLVKYRVSLRLPENQAVKEAEAFIADDFPGRGVKLRSSQTR